MATTRIIFLFNLKAGVSIADYEEWARRRDVPNVRVLNSVESFNIFRATGCLGAGVPPYAYIEIIDLADMDRFAQDIARGPMTELAAEFRPRGQRVSTV